MPVTHSRTIHWAFGALWLAIGTGVARLAPLFLGMAFAREYTSATYANYVAFVVAVNLIASIPLMGVTQLILSEQKNATVSNLLAQYFLSHFVVHAICWCGVSLFCLILPSYIETANFSISSLLALYFYSLGYCLTGLASSAFNKVGRRSYSGGCWIASSVISTVCGILGIKSHLSQEAVFSLLMGGWFAGGVLCLYVGFHRTTDVVTACRVVQGFKLGAWQVILYGAPSVVYLVGFFLLIQKTTQSADPALLGAFSLGYQLFSAALFLPGVLGNMVTPHLIRISPESRSRTRFIFIVLGIYIFIGLSWFFVTYFSLPVILSAFNLPSRGDVRYLILVLQACAGVATLLALFNQLMVAERMSKHILGSALIWLVTSNVFIMRGEDVTSTAAIAMLGAYVVSFFYTTVVWGLKKKYEKN